ncbi:conserved Plasmodium protein, unknown function [Plasmodium relictum]|uniref:Fam-b protein n=1 Tax=Plasmodium relictum TaxID=85471 RepID=A0A1J1H4D6_PLARL|nr:conserved Plasmodium protein, unknown function [Plasmodium relictum]CRG99775.1 conserved Plasmodium protein, unknown function [Plasmodium relictum]
MAYLVFFLFLIISIHKSVNIDNSNNNIIKKNTIDLNQNNNYNEENYFNREDEYYVREDGEKLINSEDLLENNRHNLIDYNDIEKINNLKSLKDTNIMQEFQKSYYKNDLNDRKLNKQIKEILSLALSIPVKDINLHDINLLLKKWRNISKTKKNSNKISNNEYYFKKIKNHNTHSNNNRDKSIELQRKEKKNQNNFITIDYLMGLTCS